MVEKKEEFVRGKKSNWEEAVFELSEVAKAYPQTAYCGLSKLLQHEWAYIQCVIPDIGPLFETLYQTIKKKFMLSLFGSSLLSDEKHIAELAQLPVKHAGLSLPNPVSESDQNYIDSTIMVTHLLACIRGRETFCLAEHNQN